LTKNKTLNLVTLGLQERFLVQKMTQMAHLFMLKLILVALIIWVQSNVMVKNITKNLISGV